ncbi:MAG: hypothetical protein ABJA79_03190 [Parafilimonas sp.]
MLATVVDKPFSNANWIYEIKWDGYRAVSFLKKGKVEILSRNLLSYNKIFKPVAEALEQLKINAVLDGEVVALNEKVYPIFKDCRTFAKPASLQNLFIICLILFGMMEKI